MVKLETDSLSSGYLEQISVTELRGVGPSGAEKLAKLNIHSVQDILFHLPLRYQDRTHIMPMNALRHLDHVLIEGTIIDQQIYFAKRRQLVLSLQDAQGVVQLRFFYFSTAQQRRLSLGTRLRCFGEVRWWHKTFVMIHPEYHIIEKGGILAVDDCLTPIYPSTEGLQQKTWIELTTQALCLAKNYILEDYLIPTWRAQFQDFSLLEALDYLHRPPTGASLNMLQEGQHPAQQRLAFEELLAHFLSLQQLRQQWQQHAAFPLPCQTGLKDKLLAALGFQLTSAQQRVCSEVERDLGQSYPMLRLVQGDVGSGKTVIAALAALQTIANGQQVALMVPTELLAEQHYRKFKQWFEPLGIRVGWLSGSLKTKAKRNALENILLGLEDIVIGTHALFQQNVRFKQLALAIVDEQHRFGVHQRLALQTKGQDTTDYPHQLIMTATPIPRTLAMTVYADLDLSIIDELPPGRQPISTTVLNNQKRDAVIKRIHALCQQGGQAYWVCTLIEESDVLQSQAASVCADELRQSLQDVSVGLIHGRMSSDEKARAMLAFKVGDIRLLVATTVIEVGVDVPNASLMVIENAERLGLAQLHQLRGRIGRGSVKSHCVLLYQQPLSETAKSRLQVMRETNDGFKIAQQDLKIRGSGEVLGTRQAGLQQFRIADIFRDKALIPQARKVAKLYLQNHPQQAEQLLKRWVGERKQFARV